MRSLYERLTAPHTCLTIKYGMCNTSTFGCVLFHWSMASVRGTHLKEEWLSFHQRLSVTSSCLAVWDILSTFSPCGDLVLLECVWHLCMLSQIAGVQLCKCPAVSRKHYFSVVICSLWLLRSFCPHFHNDSRALGRKCWWDSLVGKGAFLQD